MHLKRSENSQEIERKISFLSAEDFKGKRLDTALFAFFSKTKDPELSNLSRSQVARLIEQGLVLINGKVVLKPAKRLEVSELIEVSIPMPRRMLLAPNHNVPFSVVFEDDCVIVINKPAGVAVHPGAGNHEGTLVNALLAYLGENLKQVGDALRPGIVHRLDKDTSGLMVVAKTTRAFHSLVKQFKPPRTITRTYLALTLRCPAPTSAGLIEGNIGRHPRERKKFAVLSSGGKPARSFWRLRESFVVGALIELTLETGRTHQLRVHLSHSKAPIIGDPLYFSGGKTLLPELKDAVAIFNRQALHAWRLSFIHPVTGENLSFEAEPPKDFLHLVELFRKEKR